MPGHGRARPHYGCSKGPRRYGRIVNAYVRLGSPSKWIRIGEICADCGHLDYYEPLSQPRPQASTLKRLR